MVVAWDGGVEKGIDTSEAMVLEVSSDSGLYRRYLGKRNDIGVNTLVVVIIKEKKRKENLDYVCPWKWKGETEDKPFRAELP